MRRNSGIVWSQRGRNAPFAWAHGRAVGVSLSGPIVPGQSSIARETMSLRWRKQWLLRFGQVFGKGDKRVWFRQDDSLTSRAHDPTFFPGAQQPADRVERGT